MMTETQKNIFAIMASSNANWFIYYFKRIPLIGKILPDKIYGNISLKTIVAVVAAIMNIFGKLIWKAVYVGLMILLPVMFFDKLSFASLRYDSYVYLFFMLSMVCGSLHTPCVFSVSRDKFICIRLMGMNAKSYVVSTTIFHHLADSLLFLPPLLISSALSGGSPLQGLLLAVLLCGFRFMGEMFHLLIYARTKFILSGKTSFLIVFDLLCLAAAYIPVIFHRQPSMANVIMNPAFIIVCAALGILSIRYINKFNQYPEISTFILKSADFTKDAKQAVGQARFSDVAVREKEFSDADLRAGIFDNKEGFAYLNAIFFKRHGRLLIKPILMRLAIIAALFFACIAASYYIPDFLRPASKPDSLLPVFVFIMYFTSIGERVCRAMFYNCDISLLRYSFYREKNAVLSNFKVRLFKVASLNLIVALAISAAIVGLVLIFRLNWSTMGILFFTASIIFLSLFFSVHHLFLYYVFQPYTSELGMKNPFYNVINYGVYFVCFFCMKIKSPPSYFVLIVLLSTFVYIVAALISVYKFAPKTFRVK